MNLAPWPIRSANSAASRRDVTSAPKGDFQNFGEAELPECRYYAAQTGWKLADDGRGNQGRNVGTFTNGTQYVYNFAAFDDGTERTGAHAPAAADAFVLIDFRASILAFVNGPHGAGAFAGNSQMHNGLIGAYIMAFSAVTALGRIDMGTTVDVGNGVEPQAPMQGGNAPLTCVGDEIAGGAHSPGMRFHRP